MIEETVYTAEQVAKLFNCSLTFVYDHKELFGAIRIGKLFRFPESGLRKILNGGMEVQKQMVVQVPLPGPVDHAGRRLRDTGPGQARRGKQADRTVETADDPYGIWAAIRKSAERSGAKTGPAVFSGQQGSDPSPQ